ncbi:MAG: histidine phosphatase family protein [Ignavibacterium sp.]|jgi:phosphohistidine phosphatase|nr:histidine phosphatase family protein [Ignavibacterium sp.]
MKNLILIRHAKSSWKDDSIKDFDRPLNKRGKCDAPRMADRLLKRGFVFDLIISSSAKRTSDTAKIFADHLGFDSKIVLVDKLYLASDREILGIINQFEERYRSVIVVCHNPGITDLANYLNDFFIDNIPTTGIVGLTLNGNWSDLGNKSCKMLFFDYPKKFLIY